MSHGYSVNILVQENAGNLPSDKDSIYFLADKSGDSLNIRRRSEAVAFIKRV